MSDKIIFNGEAVGLNERHHIRMDIARLYDLTEMTLDFEVIRGDAGEHVLFVSSALHGDEINGTEIIRRLLTSEALKGLKGTVIAAPIVNAYGFNTKSRYLPDRRDLNRSFPGSESGSLAARLADVFLKEIVDKSTHGIDLHTGAINRTNWPQIRGCFDDPLVKAMAEDFGAPVILDEPLRDGSLREYCAKQGIPMILYEGGEALRFQKKAIQCGVDGILHVMVGLGMLDPACIAKPRPSVQLVSGNFWVRAPESGMLVTRKHLGEAVTEGEVLGVMTDAFGHEQTPVIAPFEGIIIGATTTPLLNQGDAAYHIAQYAGG